MLVLGLKVKGGGSTATGGDEANGNRRQKASSETTPPGREGGERERERLIGGKGATRPRSPAPGAGAKQSRQISVNVKQGKISHPPYHHPPSTTPVISELTPAVLRCLQRCFRQSDGECAPWSLRPTCRGEFQEPRRLGRQRSEDGTGSKGGCEGSPRYAG